MNHSNDLTICDYIAYAPDYILEMNSNKIQTISIEEQIN